MMGLISILWINTIHPIIRINPVGCDNPDVPNWVRYKFRFVCAEMKKRGGTAAVWRDSPVECYSSATRLKSVTYLGCEDALFPDVSVYGEELPVRQLTG